MNKGNLSIQLTDFKRGRLTPNKVSVFSLPENSMSEVVNVDFDTKLGSAIPRKGAVELVGGLGASHGTGTFKNSAGTINVVLMAVDAGIKRWDGSTMTNSTATVTSNVPVRFATLGNRVFYVNGGQMRSSADGTTWTTDNCITGSSPTLILRNKQHMLCAGDATYPDRVYFSSVINPTTNPFITWNTTTFASANGGWIDVNPDDSDNVSALQETSDTVIIFKEHSMYRLDTISKSVQSTNLYNVGATNQEATTRCRGMVYFYTGKEIMRTDGGYPEQISRIAVQDYIDAAAPNINEVNLFADNTNVYVSIGTVTKQGKAHSNVVLKFNVLDETWTTYEYPRFVRGIVEYNRELVGGADSSFVKLQTGYTDFGENIPFALETQNLLVGNVHKKSITNRIIFATRYANSTSMYAVLDGLSGKKKTIELPARLDDFITQCSSVNAEFRTIAFGWKGTTNDGYGDTAPELLGILVDDITDLGMVL